MPKEQYYSIAADMWSFGCMVFELLEGRPLTRGVRAVVEDIAVIIGPRGEDKPRLLQTKAGAYWEIVAQ